MTRDDRRACCTGRVRRAANLRHVAAQAPDRAELETARWMGETAPINRVESTLEARLIQLYAKPDLTAHDFKVADFLSRQMERLAR
jgi:hypothetical protein